MKRNSEEYNKGYEHGWTDSMHWAQEIVDADQNFPTESLEQLLDYGVWLRKQYTRLSPVFGAYTADVIDEIEKNIKAAHSAIIDNLLDRMEEEGCLEWHETMKTS